MTRKMTDAERQAARKRRKILQRVSMFIGVVLALGTIVLIIEGNRTIEQHRNAQHAVPSSQSSHTETAQNNTTIPEVENNGAEESKVENSASEASGN